MVFYSEFPTFLYMFTTMGDAARKQHAAESKAKKQVSQKVRKSSLSTPPSTSEPGFELAATKPPTGPKQG